MCSICGMIDFKEKPDVLLCGKMGSVMKHRGPDASDIFSDEAVVLQHNRLSVMDPQNGGQPMRVTYRGREYVIAYNGEIYNSPELRKNLERHGAHFRTECDTETVLWSYIIYGTECPKSLNGIFAFSVYDIHERKVFFARDRMGVKPFFYNLSGSTFSFASEIKALLQNDKISRKVSQEGLWQLIFLTPVTLSGTTVFESIEELKPAMCGEFSEKGLKLWDYWKLEAKPFQGDTVDAAEATADLLNDAITRQTVSDVPLCTFLSGGLDSSVITAVVAECYRKKGEVLSTYSFEYEGNKQSFKSTLFQPQGDDEFAVYLSRWLGTDHTVLTAPNKEVADRLLSAVDARDFPGQADIDSSLLYFCSEIKKRHTVALSGECSDEIFGGYPWFYRPEMLYRDFFPWIHEPMERAGVFRRDVAKAEEGFKFLSNEYRKIIADCPTLPGDSDAMRQSRIATCLSVGYFMTSLLERKDRMSMWSGVEVRVPFADHRILEYVYNVPWEIKFENGVEKALLRNAMKDWLPDKILWRKKSPYPKTHNPEYRKRVTEMLQTRLKKGGLLSEMIDRNVLNGILEGEDKTWFGQLMSTPQLIAWLVQFDYWLEDHRVEF
ncbi:MAG: asparagine synthase (glutamine-hydrolyzing) [Ruminococcaceae bacterium]|nr:asparagine synthase (glutamine-hydrolyzing) [Oscillospiraceae bacterium]